MYKSIPFVHLYRLRQTLHTVLSTLLSGFGSCSGCSIHFHCACVPYLCLCIQNMYFYCYYFSSFFFLPLPLRSSFAPSVHVHVHVHSILKWVLMLFWQSNENGVTFSVCFQMICGLGLWKIVDFVVVSQTSSKLKVERLRTKHILGLFTMGFSFRFIHFDFDLYNNTYLYRWMLCPV